MKADSPRPKRLAQRTYGAGVLVARSPFYQATAGAVSPQLPLRCSYHVGG